MRTLVITGLLMTMALVLGPPPSSSAASCDESSCGVPSCWDQSIRLRPERSRTVSECGGVAKAELVSSPAQTELTNISADSGSLRFDIRPGSDAPRFVEAVFELTGYGGETIKRHMSFEVVPLSENTAPVCDGDQVTQRSDGTGPATVMLFPWCTDAEDDALVMEGGGPGVHPGSPRTVEGGSGTSGWPYRTATFSGEETTTVWATDALGARSEDAELKVTVGPGIDRPPECRPWASWAPEGSVVPVWSRPGAIRRFGMYCTDPDGDAFTASVSSPPERGQLAAFDVGEQTSYYGSERPIDATYVPADDSLEPDPFSVTATGGPAVRMAITPRVPPTNAGGSCGWGPGYFTVDVPGTLELGCGDDDGDPLTAEIVTGPHHGTIAPAVVSPAPYGQSAIEIPYVPDPGFEGYDCISVKVSDGYGLVFDMPIDIWVQKVPPPIEYPPYLPPLPPVRPPLPVGGLPDPAQVRAAVQRALGTTAVKRLRRIGRTEVWGRSKLSRQDLVRYGRAPGVVVVCSKQCQIHAGSKLAPGVAPVRKGRPKTLAAAKPGQPYVVSLTLSSAERRALRRAGKRRGKFALTVTITGGHAHSVKPAIPIGR